MRKSIKGYEVPKVKRKSHTLFYKHAKTNVDSPLSTINTTSITMHTHTYKHILNSANSTPQSGTHIAQTAEYSRSRNPAHKQKSGK